MNFDWEEKNDRPRGIVAKANRYAAEKVPVTLIGAEMPEAMLVALQALHLMYFNAFIAGAHAALELESVKSNEVKEGK